MKEQITLIFPTVPELWAFVKAIEVTSVEICTRDHSLICQCSEDEIRLAFEKFHGKPATALPQ